MKRGVLRAAFPLEAKRLLMAFGLQKVSKKFGIQADFQNVANGFKVLWFENVTRSLLNRWADYFSYAPNHVDSFLVNLTGSHLSSPLSHNVRNGIRGEFEEIAHWRTELKKFSCEIFCFPKSCRSDKSGLQVLWATYHAVIRLRSDDQAIWIKSTCLSLSGALSWWVLIYQFY